MPQDPYTTAAIASLGLLVLALGVVKGVQAANRWMAQDRKLAGHRIRDLERDLEHLRKSVDPIIRSGRGFTRADLRRGSLIP